MARALRLGPALLSLALAAAALRAAEVPPPSDEVQVLFPPDRALLAPGTYHIIVRGGKAKLLVDGKAKAWEPFQPPLRVALVALTPGRHEIRVGGRRVQVMVAAKPGDAPGGWESFRCHSIDAEGKRCAGCHETTRRGKVTEVGAFRPDACRECHTSVDLDVAHSHPMKPLEHCPTCHALHGSGRKSLLKAPAKTLCAACHES